MYDISKRGEREGCGAMERSTFVGFLGCVVDRGDRMNTPPSRYLARTTPTSMYSSIPLPMCKLGASQLTIASASGSDNGMEGTRAW
jgi:hypothetical protein